MLSLVAQSLGNVGLSPSAAQRHEDLPGKPPIRVRMFIQEASIRAGPPGRSVDWHDDGFDGDAEFLLAVKSTLAKHYVSPILSHKVLEADADLSSSRLFDFNNTRAFTHTECSPRNTLTSIARLIEVDVSGTRRIIETLLVSGTGLAAWYFAATAAAPYIIVAGAVIAIVEALNGNDDFGLATVAVPENGFTLFEWNGAEGKAVVIVKGETTKLKETGEHDCAPNPPPPPPKAPALGPHSSMIYMPLGQVLDLLPEVEAEPGNPAGLGGEEVADIYYTLMDTALSIGQLAAGLQIQEAAQYEGVGEAISLYATAQAEPDPYVALDYYRAAFEEGFRVWEDKIPYDTMLLPKHLAYIPSFLSTTASRSFEIAGALLGLTEAELENGYTVNVRGLPDGMSIGAPVTDPDFYSFSVPVDIGHVAPGTYELEMVARLKGSGKKIAAPVTVVVNSLCKSGEGSLCLGEDRFEIEVDWTDFKGNTGYGKAVSLTSDTGYFWFFDPDNLELAVKVLDGRQSNGHFWVFYGALTNVAYTLRVTDTLTGRVKTYDNPLREFASRGDTRAFREEEASLVAPGPVPLVVDRTAFRAPAKSADAAPAKSVEPPAATVSIEVPDRGSGLRGTAQARSMAANDQLYDQSEPASGSRIASQDFAAGQNEFDSQSADDFVVPAGVSWRVEQIEATGTGEGPGALNVFFYADNGGLPGDEVYRALGLTPNGGLDSNSAARTYVIDLPSPVILQPGTYWLSLQAVTDVPGDQWFWARRAGQRNSAAAWRNPAGGFGGGCTDWDVLSNCVAGTGPDLLFSLLGEDMAGTMCEASPTSLCLGKARFRAEIAWTDFNDRTGSGQGVPLTDDTGLFWFFDAANIEVAVKVLDARGSNGCFWVFYGALTNVEYTMTVTDTQTGEVRTFLNPSGRFASAGDTGAFCY